MRAASDLASGPRRFPRERPGESAWLLIGLTGMGAAVGAQALWVVTRRSARCRGGVDLLCGRFKRLTDRYDSITIPDYLESRLRDTSHRIRLVAAFTLVVFVTIYVSAQIDAIGTAFEGFLGWNYYLGAIDWFHGRAGLHRERRLRGRRLVGRLSGKPDGHRPSGIALLWTWRRSGAWRRR